MRDTRVFFFYNNYIRDFVITVRDFFITVLRAGTAMLTAAIVIAGTSRLGILLQIIIRPIASVQMLAWRMVIWKIFLSRFIWIR